MQVKSKYRLTSLVNVGIVIISDFRFSFNPTKISQIQTQPSHVFRCNTDLTDNELEITVVQGVNYNVPNPKVVDTYVRFEFPAPSNVSTSCDVHHRAWSLFVVPLQSISRKVTFHPLAFLM